MSSLLLLCPERIESKTEQETNHQEHHTVPQNQNYRTGILLLSSQRDLDRNQQWEAPMELDKVS